MIRRTAADFGIALVTNPQVFELAAAFTRHKKGDILAANPSDLFSYYEREPSTDAWTGANEFREAFQQARPLSSGTHTASISRVARDPSTRAFKLQRASRLAKEPPRRPVTVARRAGPLWAGELGSRLESARAEGDDRLGPVRRESSMRPMGPGSGTWGPVFFKLVAALAGVRALRGGAEGRRRIALLGGQDGLRLALLVAALLEGVDVVAGPGLLGPRLRADVVSPPPMVEIFELRYLDSICLPHEPWESYCPGAGLDLFSLSAALL